MVDKQKELCYNFPLDTVRRLGAGDFLISIDKGESDQ